MLNFILILNVIGTFIIASCTSMTCDDQKKRVRPSTRQYHLHFQIKF